MLFQFPAQNIEPIHPRHIEIQKDNAGSGKFSAVGKPTFACEQVERILARAGDKDGIFNSARLKGAKQKENIGFRIICNKDGERF